jgi:protein phosphatase
MRANVSIDVHPYTDRGRRDYQEDYFYTDPPMRPGAPWLGVVSDGMGGHQSGDLASRAGVHALKRAFDAFVERHIRTEQALVKATVEGHKAVLKAAAEANAVGNMGATVVAFVVDGPTLFWCSAGDSRLYLYRDERLIQLSRDFTLAEDMRRGVANGDWTAEDIENSPQKNALTSFMGTDSWRHHAGSQELQHGDVIIACSDGVYGTIDSDGIVAACRTAGGAPSAQVIVESLQRRVLEVAKSNQDNSTAIVVRFVAPVRSNVADVPTRTPFSEKNRLPLFGGIAAGLLGVGALAAYLIVQTRTPDIQLPATQQSQSNPPAAQNNPSAFSVPKPVVPLPALGASSAVGDKPSAQQPPSFDEMVKKREAGLRAGKIAPGSVDGVIASLKQDFPKESADSLGIVRLRQFAAWMALKAALKDADVSKRNKHPEMALKRLNGARAGEKLKVDQLDGADRQAAEADTTKAKALLDELGKTQGAASAPNPKAPESDTPNPQNP